MMCTSQHDNSLHAGRGSRFYFWCSRDIMHSAIQHTKDIAALTVVHKFTLYTR